MPIGSFIHGVLGGMDWREGRDARKVQRTRDDQRWGWEGEDREWMGEQRDWAREDRSHAMSRRAQAEADRAAAEGRRHAEEAQRREDMARWSGYVNAPVAGASQQGFSVRGAMTGTTLAPWTAPGSPITGWQVQGASRPPPQTSGGHGASAALPRGQEFLRALRGVA